MELFLCIITALCLVAMFAQLLQLLAYDYKDWRRRKEKADKMNKTLNLHGENKVSKDDFLY